MAQATGLNSAISEWRAELLSTHSATTLRRPRRTRVARISARGLAAVNWRAELLGPHAAATPPHARSTDRANKVSILCWRSDCFMFRVLFFFRTDNLCRHIEARNGVTSWKAYSRVPATVPTARRQARVGPNGRGDHLRILGGKDAAAHPERRGTSILMPSSEPDIGRFSGGSSKEPRCGGPATHRPPAEDAKHRTPKRAQGGDRRELIPDKKEQTSHPGPQCPKGHHPSTAGDIRGRWSGGRCPRWRGRVQAGPVRPCHGADVVVLDHVLHDGQK